MRNRSTLDFLTVWEQLYNPNFKVFGSEHFRKQVGLLTFTLSVSEWCEKTNAIGMYSKIGKYGGTYHIRILHLNLHQQLVLCLNYFNKRVWKIKTNWKPKQRMGYKKNINKK